MNVNDETWFELNLSIMCEMIIHAVKAKNSTM